jgi:hypothetical protein
MSGPANEESLLELLEVGDEMVAHIEHSGRVLHPLLGELPSRRKALV